MQCKGCNNKTRLPHHKFCSKECYWRSLAKLKGENAPNWKSVVGKARVHHWLYEQYGGPMECERVKGMECRGTSACYDWALIRGKKYERKRENFLRLCRSCHRRYDSTPELIKKGNRNLWWSTGHKIKGDPKSPNLWWGRDKEKMKQYYERTKKKCPYKNLG